MVYAFQRRSEKDIVNKLLCDETFANRLLIKQSYEIGGSEEWDLVTELVNEVLHSHIRSPEEVAEDILDNFTVSRKVLLEFSIADPPEGEDLIFVRRLREILPQRCNVESMVQQDRYIPKILELMLTWIREFEEKETI
jgi:hypothetical protein